VEKRMTAPPIASTTRSTGDRPTGWLRGTAGWTPHLVQTGVSNFFDNLEYPLVMVNDLLQGQFMPSSRDTGRLLLNTTSYRRLMDPATAAGLEKNDRDFGQTLAVGRPTGPYLVIPFLGPSDLRDAVGRLAMSMHPRHSSANSYVDYGLWLVRRSTRAHACWTPRVRSTSAYDRTPSCATSTCSTATSRSTRQSLDEEQQEQKLWRNRGRDPADARKVPPRPPAPPRH